MWSLLWVACSRECPGLAYVDEDGDGVGDKVAADCSADNIVAVGNDCDDRDPAVFPGAVERCETAGIDDDCDGRIDAEDDDVEDMVAVRLDRDGDGYGTEELTKMCAPGAVEPVEPGDCDDEDETIHPRAEEIVDDGIDQDCSGHDDCYFDADRDGYAGEQLEACSAPNGGFEEVTDCDDADFSVHPEADDPFFDGADIDCDGFDAPAFTWPTIDGNIRRVDAGWINGEWGIIGISGSGNSNFANLVAPDALHLQPLLSDWYGNAKATDVSASAGRLGVALTPETQNAAFSNILFDPAIIYPNYPWFEFNDVHDVSDVDIEGVGQILWTVGCGQSSGVTRLLETEWDAAELDLPVQGTLCSFLEVPTSQSAQVEICNPDTCERFSIEFQEGSLASTSLGTSPNPGLRAAERRGPVRWWLDQGMGVHVDSDTLGEVHLLSGLQVDDVQVGQRGTALYAVTRQGGELVLSRWQGGTEARQTIPVLDPETGEPMNITDVALATGGGVMVVFAAEGRVGWLGASL